MTSRVTMPQPVNIPGNFYDKHTTRNPLARLLMGNFYKAFDGLAGSGHQSKAFEVGCGEGHLMKRLADLGWKVKGIDLEPSIIGEANGLLHAHGLEQSAETGSIYDLPKGALKDFDLVVCCEVLEHLPDPIAGLRDGGARRLILSVPREPIWRALNIARGKYLRDLGNTPGHLNHWSSTGFVGDVERFFKVEEVRQPLPWTFVHAKPRLQGP